MVMAHLSSMVHNGVIEIGKVKASSQWIIYLQHLPISWDEAYTLIIWIAQVHPMKYTKLGEWDTYT